MKFVVLFGLALAACSTGEFDQPKPEPKASPTPPKPSPTPEKKPEPVFQCKISDGAGRIFKAVDESKFRSETKARHNCQVFSKVCISLGCTEQEGDPDSAQ